MSGQLTWQIRWVDSGPIDKMGFVGRTGDPLFRLAKSPGGGWVLIGYLSKDEDALESGGDLDALKVWAEEWLRDWLAKLGGQVLAEAAERAC